MRDDLLELWLRFLALHVEDPTEPGTVATKIRDQWLLASRGFFTGCVPDGLEEAVANTDGRVIVRKAVESLTAALRKAPQEIDKSTLNLMSFGGGIHREFRNNQAS